MKQVETPMHETNLSVIATVLNPQVQTDAVCPGYYSYRRHSKSQQQRVQKKNVAEVNRLAIVAVFVGLCW